MADSPLPKGITKEQIIRYGRLDVAKKRAEKELKPLNALIKATFNKQGAYAFSDDKVSVLIDLTPTSTFDAASAQEQFPIEDFPEYYKSVFDASLLPADVAETFKEKSLRLSAKVIDTSESV